MRYHTKNLLRISLSIGLFVLLFLLPVSKDTEQVVSLTPLLAHAASCPAGQVPDGEGGCITYEDQRPKDPNASSTTPGTTGGGTQDVSCSWTSGVECFIGKLFYYAVFVTFGFLVYIAANFFDFIVKLSIVDFHTWVGLPGVRIAWTVLRDTMNITFIFLLLYASISMILGLGKEKGIIKGVILAGLLINFSFFFTSVIIDVSNVTTVQMYEAVKTIGNNASETSANSNVEARMDGITAVFMQGTGIQVSNIAGLNGKEFTSKIMQQMIFSSIEFLVLAFVFFAMAFLLLGRFIVLLILLVTSPISVMGGLLPQLSQYSKQWWKEMINQATFAPIMMLFLVVTAVIVSNPEFRNSFSRDSIGGLVGGVQGLAQYAIVIGLLIVGIITAKQSAGAASNGAADWAIKKAQGAPGAIGGFFGRNLVGRGARWTGEKYDRVMGRMDQLDWKDKNGNRRGVIGTIGVGAGKFVSGVARRTPIDESLRDTFKATAASKFGSQESLADREKAYLQRTKELGQAVKDSKTEATIASGMKLTKELHSKNKYSTDHTIKDASGKDIKPIEDFIKEVGRLTNNQIEEMLQKNDKRLTDQTFASALTAKHMDKIMESVLISDKAKGDIATARENGMLARLDAKRVSDVAAEAARFASGKPAEVAQLPAKVLADQEVASRLSVGTLSKIASDGKVSESDKQNIKKSIRDKIDNLNKIANWSPDQTTQADNAQNLLDWLKTDTGKIF